MTEIRYIDKGLRIKLCPMDYSSFEEFKLQRKKWWGWKTTAKAIVVYHIDKSLPELINLLFDREKGTLPFHEEALKILNQPL